MLAQAVSSPSGPGPRPAQPEPERSSRGASPLPAETMASPKERMVALLRSLDLSGSGAVPRTVFEGLMRRVYPENLATIDLLLARAESLGFVVARAEGAEIRYEELLGWIYGEPAERAEDAGQANARPAPGGPRGGVAGLGRWLGSGIGGHG